MSNGDAMVRLSDALEAVRQELEQAWRDSHGQRVRFRADAVTLTVEAVVRTETKGGGKVRWWLIEAGADRGTTREATQTLELTLTPQLFDDAGQAQALNVAGEQDEPAR